MSLPWHPRNHQDALDGMLLLTLEERGAYNTILDLIYQRSGPVPDDDRWLAGWMGCSVKKWRLIRAALLVKGKLYASDKDGQPALMNERARLELESASTRRRVAAESGAKGGRKTAQTITKPNENNSAEQATLEGSLQLSTSTSTEQEKDREASLPAATAVATVKAKAAKPWLDPEFSEAWDLCTPDMRRRSHSREITFAHWKRQAAIAGSGTVLKDALAAYLRQDPDVKRTGGPGFHIWLKDGTWEHWTGEAASAAGATVIDADAVQRRREENRRLYEDAS